MAESKWFFRRVAGVAFILVFLAGCRSAQSYVDKGNTFFAQGKYAEASLNYRKATQKNPNYGEAYYRLGLSELKENKPLAAFQSFMQAVRLMPDHKGARSEVENLALTSYIGDPQHPKALYDLLVGWSNEWLKKDPSSPEGLRIKGYLAILDRRPQEAVDLFSRAHQANPKDLRLTLGLIDALYRNHQEEAAEKVGLDCIAADKTAGEAYDALYRFYLATNRPADAENILIRKVQANPKENRYILQLAAHYANVRKKQEMERTLQMLLTNPGGDPRVLLAAGDFYAALGDWKHALDQYNAGLAGHPQDKSIYQDRIARALISENKRDDGLKLLNTELAQNPTDTEAQALRAALLLSSSQSSTASQGLDEFRGIVEKNPDDLFLKYVYAKALLERKNIAGARTELLEVVRSFPHFKDAQVTLADIAYTQRNMSEVVQHADAALEVAPNDIRAQLLRASALIELGDLNRASSALASLAVEAPQLVEVRLAQAVLTLRQERYSEAEAAFKKILVSNPNDWRAVSGLADTYLAAKEPEAAFSMLDTELQRSHGSPQIHSLLAATAMKTGRYSVAIENLQRLADQETKTIDPEIDLAEVYRLRGDIHGAIAVLQRAATLQPKDPRPNSMLPFLLELDNKKQEAKALCRRNLSQHPDDLVSMNNLAYMLADTGDSLDEALRLANQVVKKQPGSDAFADTLGYVYLKRDQNDEALQIFERLIRKHPDDPTLLYHLGMARYQKGDRQRAKDAFARALQFGPSKEVEASVNDVLNHIK